MTSLAGALADDLAPKAAAEIERIITSQPERGVQALVQGGMAQEEAEKLIADPAAAAKEIKRRPGQLPGSTAEAPASASPTPPGGSAQATAPSTPDVGNTQEVAPPTGSVAMPPPPSAGQPPTPPPELKDLVQAPGVQPSGLSTDQKVGAGATVVGSGLTLKDALSGDQPPGGGAQAPVPSTARLAGPPAPVAVQPESDTEETPEEDSRKPGLVSAGLAPKPLSSKEYTKVLDNALTALGTKPTGKVDLDPAEIAEWKRQNLELMRLYDQAKTSNQWAEVAETMGHALAQFAAAKKGAELGVDLSGLKFDKTDWLGRNNQLLDELKQKLGVQSENRRIEEDQVKNARDVLRDWQRRSAELNEKKANISLETDKENDRRLNEWNARRQQADQENARNMLSYDTLVSAETRAAAATEQRAEAARLRFEATQNNAKASPADKQAESRRQLINIYQQAAEAGAKDRSRLLAMVPKVAAASGFPPDVLQQIHDQASKATYLKSSEMLETSKRLSDWDKANPIVGARLGAGASGSWAPPAAGGTRTEIRQTADGTRWQFTLDAQGKQVGQPVKVQ